MMRILEMSVSEVRRLGLGAEARRRDWIGLDALVDVWNVLTAPYVLRSEREHARAERLARAVDGRMRRRFAGWWTETEDGERRMRPAARRALVVRCVACRGEGALSGAPERTRADAVECEVCGGSGVEVRS